MAKRPDTVDAELVTTGFACYLQNKKHKRGVIVGRVYHSQSAAEQCVELYKRSAVEGDVYTLREVKGFD